MNATLESGRVSAESAQLVSRTEDCSVASARRVAAMLDLDPDTVVEGTPLPRGWQFLLMGADTRRSTLRADGFPGLGVPMPELGLPRLLLGGRTVKYLKDIPIGATLKRNSSLDGVTRKKTEAGLMAVTTLRHELQLADGTPALVETQTYLLLPARKGAAPVGVPARVETMTAERRATVTPDETLLFQYSALGFNSHRIHIDRSHARRVEGYPDLVVNGGLATLLLTEFLRRDLGLVPSGFKARHTAPLFCGRHITMTANRADKQWHLKAYDDRNVLAVDMEVDIQ